jgi:glycosyltransferase involved in cell wall biosynthesis
MKWSMQGRGVAENGSENRARGLCKETYPEESHLHAGAEYAGPVTAPHGLAGVLPRSEHKSEAVAKTRQVWILNHYALEPSCSGGTRHFGLATHLHDHGWNATLIAASVDHHSGRQRLAEGERFRCETHANVPFVWIRTPVGRGNGGRRMLNMLAYTLRVMLPVYTRNLPRPDVIVGSSVHPLAAAAGLFLARRHGVPFVFEVRDLWPQTLVDFGRLAERSAMTWTLRRIERFLYQHATRIIVLMPYAADYIEGMGIDRRKVTWIPNGVEVSSFNDISPPGPVVSRPFVLMYLGAHGQANGMHHVLEAMKLVQERAPEQEILLRMIGDGPAKASLIEQARTLGLKNISFEEPVPKSMVPSLCAQADGFIISVVGLPRVYRYGISMNKLFDYLAACRPIIIASSAANNPVQDSGSGITVAPENPAEIAEAIVALSKTPHDERLRMGRSGRAYVETHHGFHRLAEKMARELNQCCTS